MTEAELISAVAADTGYPRVTVRNVLQSVGVQVMEVLAQGGEAVIPHVGKLRTVQRAARKARNPKTGAEVSVPVKVGVKFMARKILRERLASSLGTVE